MDITEDYKNQVSQAQFLKSSRESTIEREKPHSPSTPVQGKLAGFTNSSSIRKLSFGSLDNGSSYKGSDSGQKSPKPKIVSPSLNVAFANSKNYNDRLNKPTTIITIIFYK